MDCDVGDDDEPGGYEAAWPWLPIGRGLEPMRNVQPLRSQLSRRDRRSRAIRVSALERRQMRAVRDELDH